MVIQYKGLDYRVIQSYRHGYIAVALVGHEINDDLFFAQGEEAEEYLDMQPVDLLDWLDSAGVL